MMEDMFSAPCRDLLPGRPLLGAMLTGLYACARRLFTVATLF